MKLFVVPVMEYELGSGLIQTIEIWLVVFRVMFFSLGNGETIYGTTIVSSVYCICMYYLKAVQRYMIVAPGVRQKRHTLLIKDFRAGQRITFTVEVSGSSPVSPDTTKHL